MTTYKGIPIRLSPTEGTRNYKPEGNGMIQVSVDQS